MKFTCSATIDQPRSKVIELFNDPNNLKEWQDGFISMEHLSGNAGEPGAKSRLLYKINNREMELIETITENNLPEELSGVYEAKTMTNNMTNRFTVLGDHQTRYDMQIEYTAFRGFIPKMMAFFLPGMFKRQTQKWLNQFKAFAEREKT